MRNIGKQSSKRPRLGRKPLDQYWRSAEELAEDQEPRSVFGLCVAELLDPRAYLPKEWSEGLLSSPDVRPFASADGLANLEAHELGRAEVEGLVLSGPW